MARPDLSAVSSPATFGSGGCQTDFRAARSGLLPTISFLPHDGRPRRSTLRLIAERRISCGKPTAGGFPRPCVPGSGRFEEAPRYTSSWPRFRARVLLMPRDNATCAEKKPPTSRATWETASAITKLRFDKERCASRSPFARPIDPACDAPKSARLYLAAARGDQKTRLSRSIH